PSSYSQRSPIVPLLPPPFHLPLPPHIFPSTFSPFSSPFSPDPGSPSYGFY
ncbi:hypothetical protein BO94DRAFT_567078, partial [Aspergillus sclerotioniger CBS 115572]